MLHRRHLNLILVLQPTLSILIVTSATCIISGGNSIILVPCIATLVAHHLLTSPMLIIVICQVSIAQISTMRPITVFSPHHHQLAVTIIFRYDRADSSFNDIAILIDR